MKLSVQSFKKTLQSKTAILCIAALLLSPVALVAQSNDDDGEPVETSTSTGGGPWENSASTTIGSGNAAATQGTARPSDPSLSTTTAARPAAGPTVDATGGPGGNPDVPFDSNMNLVFLAAGVAFAYIVYRRRLKLKTVPAQKN